MKVSEQLRAGRDYMATHGFDPEMHGSYDDKGTFLLDICAQCFLGASGIAANNRRAPDSFGPVRARILAIVDDVSASALRADGWNTADAIAALEIAADIAEAEGV